MKNYLSFLLAALVGFCSCSEDSEGVYDEVLSNTVWTQTYIEPGYSFTYPSISDLQLEAYINMVKSYFSYLQFEEMPMRHVRDTFPPSTQEYGNYLLSFTNSTCRLTHTMFEDKTYGVRTYEVLPVYYPDQTFIGTDENSIPIEVVIRKDSAFVKDWSSSDVRNISIPLPEDNIFYMKMKIIEETEYSVVDTEGIETIYDMDFVRNGNKVQLTGDKNITGTLNDSMDEIDFDEIGTVYRQ